MSGGRFDYFQYRIAEIYDSIENEIEHNNEDPGWWGEFRGYRYEDDTLEIFKKAIAFLKIAEVYANRIDYLLEGDDGENDLQRRLKQDLDGLVHNDKYGYVKKFLEN